MLGERVSATPPRLQNEAQYPAASHERNHICDHNSLIYLSLTREGIMNRLLSRREKDGYSHRRQHSRDKSSSHHSDKKEPDKKVPYPDVFLCFPSNHSYWFNAKSVFRSVSSLSAAFPKPHGKAQPSIQPSTFSSTVTTCTNGRFGLQLQTRYQSDEIISLLKYGPQRKLDNEQDAKVRGGV